MSKFVYRRVYNPDTNMTSGTQPVSRGGTSAATALQALANLGMIASNRLGVAGGAVRLGANSKVDAANLPAGFGTANQISIDGPVKIEPNKEYVYTITDFDSSSPCDVSVSAGSVEREGAIITLKAPASDGLITLTVGNQNFQITVETIRILGPSVIWDVQLSDTDFIYAEPASNPSLGPVTVQSVEWIVRDKFYLDSTPGGSVKTTLTEKEIVKRITPTIHYNGSSAENWAKDIEKLGFPARVTVSAKITYSNGVVSEEGPETTMSTLGFDRSPSLSLPAGDFLGITADDILIYGVSSPNSGNNDGTGGGTVTIYARKLDGTGSPVPIRSLTYSAMFGGDYQGTTEYCRVSVSKFGRHVALWVFGDSVSQNYGFMYYVTLVNDQITVKTLWGYNLSGDLYVYAGQNGIPNFTNISNAYGDPCRAIELSGAAQRSDGKEEYKLFYCNRNELKTFTFIRDLAKPLDVSSSYEFLNSSDEATVALQGSNYNFIPDIESNPDGSLVSYSIGSSGSTADGSYVKANARLYALWEDSASNKRKLKLLYLGEEANNAPATAFQAGVPQYYGAGFEGWLTPKIFLLNGSDVIVKVPEALVPDASQSAVRTYFYSFRRSKKGGKLNSLCDISSVYTDTANMTLNNNSMEIALGSNYANLFKEKWSLTKSDMFALYPMTKTNLDVSGPTSEDASSFATCRYLEARQASSVNGSDYQDLKLSIVDKSYDNTNEGRNYFFSDLRSQMPHLYRFGFYGQDHYLTVVFYYNLRWSWPCVRYIKLLNTSKGVMMRYGVSYQTGRHAGVLRPMNIYSLFWKP